MMNAMMNVPSPDESQRSATGTVPGLLRARCAQSPDAAALWQLSSTGEWISTTWGDYGKAVAALSAGFKRIGLAHGDRVGIMSATCKEWDYAQLGVLAAGGVAVGLDPYALDEHTQDISRRCNFAGVVLGHPALLEKLGDEARGKLHFIVSIEPPTAPGIVHFDSLLADAAVGDDWDQSQPDDAATLIFTSGTTGAPKGIQYSHRQMCLAVSAILSAFPDIGEGKRLACWLPLSNLFQRMINLCAIERSAQTFYVPDPRDIMKFVQIIEPHLFIGVPRFYEKLYAGMQEAIAKKPAWQRHLVHWALRIGDLNASAERAGRTCGALLKLQGALTERLVLRKLRGILGSNLHFMISGSAPMPLWLLERFHAMGLPLLEAYGLSENIIPIALNRPGRYRFGSVGQPLPGCEVRLAEDGELLVRGPGVFSGYFGEGLAEARIDAEGFLASGDFASIDVEGFITLIGRKSEIFKTSTGRRIAPTSIECHLKQVQQVEHAVVFGTRRAQPVALLIITEAAWQEDRHLLCERLRAEVAQAVAVLPAYQRPAGLVITAQALTIAGGELTANLKLRRLNIEAKYAKVLSALYSHIDAAVGTRFEAQSDDGLYLFCSL